MKEIDSDTLRSFSLDINRAVARSSNPAILRENLVDVIHEYYVS